MKPEIVASLVGTIITAIAAILVAILQKPSKDNESSQPSLLVPHGYKVLNPKSRNIWLFVLPMAFLGGFVSYMISSLFMDSSQTISTQTAEAFPQLDKTPTNDPNLLIREAENWPIVLNDTFDNNNAGWNVDGWNSDTTKIYMEIKDGTFSWRMQELREGTWYFWELAPLDSYSNFYLSARVSRAPGASFHSYYGLLFKREGDQLYEFVVDDWGQYKVSLFKDGNWTDLAGPSNSSLILSSGFNKLGVISIGEEMFFFINDTYATSIIDNSLSEGNVGIRIGVVNPTSDEIQFYFDDFVLRQTPSK